jgi:hypothetical protein
MMTSRSGLIVWHVASERAHLPEYLAEQGFDVALSLWGLADRRPRAVITDTALDALSHGHLAEFIRSGRTGFIQWGSPAGASRRVAAQVDFVLPDDATGREVVLALDLVEEIRRQRQPLADPLGRDPVRNEPEHARPVHDHLTGLANRDGWDQQLEQRLLMKQRLSIGLVDVDFFPLRGAATHDLGNEPTGRIALRVRSPASFARIYGATTSSPG